MMQNNLPTNYMHNSVFFVIQNVTIIVAVTIYVGQ